MCNCLFSLLTQIQSFDYFTISADIFELQIVQKMPSLTDQSYQRPLCTEILLVFLQVFSKVRNPIGEKSNLALSASGIYF